MKVKVIFPLLISLLVVVAFANGAVGEFVYDDIVLVRDNEGIRRLSSVFEGFWGFAKKRVASFFDEQVDLGYRPVRNATLAVDYFLTRIFFPSSIAKGVSLKPTQRVSPGGRELQIFLRPTAGGLSPIIFHLQNIFWHILNSLLVYFILLHFFPSPSICFGATLLFALHPLQTESVTYISGRRDVLAGFFVLAGFYLYLRGRGNFLSLCGVGVCFLLGLLSKEVVVVFPFLLLGYEGFCAKTKGRSFSKKAIYFILFCSLISLGFVGFKVFVKNPVSVGSPTEYWGGNLFTALLSFCRVVWFYLFLILWPISLCVDYSYAAFLPSSGLFQPEITFWAFLGLCGLVGVGIYYWDRAVGFGLFCFFLFLLPVSQFIPHPERVAEHYLYLPLFGMSLVLGYGMEGLDKKLIGRDKRILYLSVIALVIFWGVRTHLRNRDWRNSLSLWKSAVEVEPQCARARLGYGYALLQEAEKGKNESYPKAMGEFQKASEIAKSSRSSRTRVIYLNALFLQGVVHLKLAQKGWDRVKNLNRAKELLEALIESQNLAGKKIRDDRRHLFVHQNLAACYRELGMMREAEAIYKRMLTLSPNYFPALLELAKIDLLEKRWRQAQKRLLRCLSYLEKNSPLRKEVQIQLASLFLAKGDLEKAKNFLLDIDKNNLACAMLGEIYLKKLDFVRASTLLAKALPHLSPLQWRRFFPLWIEALLALKRYKQVFRATEKVLATSPKQGWVYFFQIQALLGLGKLSLAQEKIKRYSPFLTDLERDFLKAELLFSQKRCQEALALYQQILKATLSHRALMRIFEIPLDLESKKNLVQFLQKLCKQSHVPLSFSRKLARIYLEKGYYSQALELYQLLLKRGYSFLEKERQACLFLQKRVYKHKLKLAQFELLSGNHSKAQRLLDEAIFIWPTHFRAYALKGELLYRQKHWKSAIKPLKLRLALKRTGSLNARYLAMVAECYFHLGNILKAQNWAKRALKVFKDYPLALKILGLVAYKLGHFSQAKKYLEKYLQIPFTRKSSSASEQREVRKILEKTQKHLK